MADMVLNKVEPTDLVGHAADDVTSEGVLAQIAGNTDRFASGGCDLRDADVDPGFVNIDDWIEAPSRAKRNAPARPMPEAAAVTMPILFSRGMLFSYAAMLRR